MYSGSNARLQACGEPISRWYIRGDISLVGKGPRGMACAAPFNPLHGNAAWAKRCNYFAVNGYVVGQAAATHKPNACQEKCCTPKSTGVQSVVCIATRTGHSTAKPLCCCILVRQHSTHCTYLYGGIQHPQGCTACCYAQNPLRKALWACRTELWLPCG